MRNIQAKVDFGYSWVWTYGYLVLASLYLIGAILALTGGAESWIFLLMLVPYLWVFAGFLISQFVHRYNEPLELPTEDFLRNGEGKVLDLGCGSGRASIMIANARPGAEIVALDNFSADYIAGNSVEKTKRNLQIAKIADRVSVVEGDMRDIRLDDCTFDAAVSSYAIDHLGDDIPEALREAHRVLRPGGELLLVLIVPNIWTGITFSPMVQMRFKTVAYWRTQLTSEGFEIVSGGNYRGSAWVKASRL